MTSVAEDATKQITYSCVETIGEKLDKYYDMVGSEQLKYNCFYGTEKTVELHQCECYTAEACKELRGMKQLKEYAFNLKVH